METSSLDLHAQKVDQKIKALAKEAASYPGMIENLKQLLSTVGDFEKEWNALEPKPNLNKEMVRNWVTTYPAIQENAHELENNLNQLQNKLVSANLFIQEFRDYRYYMATTLKEIAAFLERASQLFNEPLYHFKPVFVGTDDFSPVINQFKLQKEQNSQTYPIAAEKLYDFLPFLVTRKQFTKGVLNNPHFKVILSTQKKILIETNNETIVRLDRLAKEMNVSALGD